MLLVTLLFLFCSTICAEKFIYNVDETGSYFEKFLSDFNKTYTDEEKRYRFEIFKESIKNINRLNELNPYAEFAINEFADKTKEEMGLIPFDSLKTTITNHKDYCTELSDIHVTTNTAPDSFDWRSKNVVTKVKDQSHPFECGSCYAFSTVGNIEGQYAIKTNKQEEFSMQQLLDCTSRNNKCNGGFMTLAMSDIMDSQGLATEKSYPYKARPNKCTFDKSKAAIKIRGCQYITIKDENKLKEFLYTNGPLSIAIDARDSLKYKGGIITTCTMQQLNHAVLLVGYGTENGVDYWLFKNSWSERYGEDGYFRLARNVNCNGLINHRNANAIIDV